MCHRDATLYEKGLSVRLGPSTLVLGKYIKCAVPYNSDESHAKCFVLGLPL